MQSFIVLCLLVSEKNVPKINIMGYGLQSPLKKAQAQIGAQYYCRMDLKEVGVNTRNWVDMAQEIDYWRALVSAALNLRVP